MKRPEYGTGVTINGKTYIRIGQHR